MKSTCLPKSVDNRSFDREFSRLLRLAPDAIKHLRKVTGKRGIGAIDPLSEKRWSNKCWDAFSELVNLKMMIMDGLTEDEWVPEAMKLFKPMDVVIKGSVKSDNFAIDKSRVKT